MSDVVPSIPSVTPQNLVDVARKLKHLVDVREGRVGDPMDANVTYRDLVAAGIAQIPPGGAPRGSVPIIATNPVEQGYDPSTDMAIPPQPTGLTASAGLTSIQLKWDAPSYQNHAYTEVWSHSADAIGDAQLIGTTTARIYVDAVGSTGIKRFYWVRHVSQAAVTGAFNATAGVSATTGKIGNTDLGPLIIEAGNLAEGAVTQAKFANGIEPVTIVSSGGLPTTKSTTTIIWSNKIYRWNGTAYVASVATTDLTGSIIGTQIADGAITTQKIFAGAITTGLIAAGAVTADELAANAVTALSLIHI